MIMDLQNRSSQAIYEAKTPISTKKSSGGCKRSFDVAFLTGSYEKANNCESPSPVDSHQLEADKVDTGLLRSEQLGSAFTKVVRTNVSSIPSPDTPASIYSYPTNSFQGSLPLSFLHSPTKSTSEPFTPSPPQSILQLPNSLANFLLPSVAQKTSNNLMDEYLRSRAMLQEKELSRSLPEISNRRKESSPTVTMEANQAMKPHASPPNNFKLPSLPYPYYCPVSSEYLPKPPMLPTAPLTTLLPSSLASLSMATQNMCAKCNLSFRMTSDLVYHMRTHHKRMQDPLRKRRDEKLKCPICQETFRERHHLTRHMTAHEDKNESAKDTTTC